jgi:hypothetical protein
VFILKEKQRLREFLNKRNCEEYVDLRQKQHEDYKKNFIIRDIRIYKLSLC